MSSSHVVGDSDYSPLTDPVKFNEKYEQFIEPGGYYGLDIDIPEVTAFLDVLFGSTLRHVPGFMYAQIKLKFGLARVYTSLPHEVNTMIERGIDSIVRSLHVEARIRRERDAAVAEYKEWLREQKQQQQHEE